MPRKLPPFVECWRDRHGKVRVYFRRGKGPRVPLPGTIGSDEFLSAYQDALAGRLAGKRQLAERSRPGTIAGLVASYMRSPEYRALRATTKQSYRTPLEALRTEHGHRSVSGLTRDRINVGILAPLADRPGAALARLKVLRVLVRHAIDIGWLDRDPTLGIRRPKGGEIRAVTEDEIAAFEAHWPVGTKQRLAFALMLHTGQRRSDVHRMTWADVEGDTIRVVQQKTGARLSIPIHPALAEVLAATPREHVAILTTAYARTFTVAGFSNWMRDGFKAAGLPLDAQPHGLRKAAGVRLANAGCTAHEIMSVLGHKTLAEAERYTRSADQARLGRSAMAKLTGHPQNRDAQTTIRKFGKTPKSEGNSA